MAKLEPIVNKDKIYTPNPKPFEGQSTYKDSYIKKSVSKPQK